MASIYDLIRRYTYGMPGQDGGQGTRGLLGSGGQMGGGGLLQQAFSSPAITGGLGLISAGMRGEGVQEALLKQSQIQQMNIKARRAKAFEDLLKRDDISEKEKAYLLAGVSPPTGTTATAAQRNFQTYKRIMEKGSEKEKRFAKQIFLSGGAGIKSKEQFLYEASQNLLKNFTPPEELSEKLKELEIIYDKTIAPIDSANNKKPSQTILNVPKNKKDLIDGQTYNVNGNPMKWNKKNNQFE